VEIKSAEVNELTSAGLGELKRLINEAAVKRRELSTQVAKDQEKLDRAKRRLRFAQSFIVRLFTRKSVPLRIHEVDTARDQLEADAAERDGCYIEVDFGFDAATLNSYASMVRAFEDLTTCQRIWAMTSVQSIDRVRERTVATRAFGRVPIGFDFATPEIVKLSERAMRLNTASGKHLYLYPGFLMMRDEGADFALIEYRELQVDFTASRFVEEEAVPSDASVVGETWKKANKDGSPDRRFNDNYSIPIVRYADLELRTGAGLHEEFQFSHFDKASTFHEALSGHGRALAALISSNHVAPPPGDTADHEEEPVRAEPQPIPAVSSDPYVLDWIALFLIVAALAVGANWTVGHRAVIGRLFHPASVEAPPASRPVAAAPTHRPAHRRQKKVHHQAAVPAGDDLATPAPSSQP
jgi:hypothetical protein